MKKITKLNAASPAFAQIAKKLNEVIDANPPIVGGTGIKVTDSTENRLITIDPFTIQNVAGVGFYHPFKVVLTNAATPACAIIAESRLYSSLSTSASYTITSLTTAITLTSSTKIWLKVSVNSSLAPTAATITTSSPSDLVTTSGSPAAQTQFHVCIGKVTSGANADAPGFDFKISGTNYHFEQTLFNHLLIENRAKSRVPIIYAFPFSGA